MLKILLKKELLANLLDSKFLLCYLAIFSLVITSIVNMGFQYKNDYEDALRKREKYEKQLAEAKDVGESQAFKVVTTPSKMRVYSLGFDKEISRTFSGYGQGDASQLANVDPLHIQYKIYDLGFIITIILSLLAIFLNYDSITAEIDSRTMHLVLSNSISKSTIILSKILGGYAILIFPLVFTWLLGTVVLTATAGIYFGPVDWLRAFLMLGLACLYLALIFLITSFYSIVFNSSVVSLLFSLVTWVLMVFIIPNSSLVFGKLVKPVPNEAAQLRLEDKIVLPRREKLRREVRLIKSGNWAVHLAWAEEGYRMSKIKHSLAIEQKNRIKDQLGFSLNLSRVSPASNFLYAFTHLAGTGFQNLFRFEDWQHEMHYAVHQYAYDEYLRRYKMVSGDTPRARNLKTQKMGPLDIKKMPGRIYKRLGTAGCLGLVVTDVVVLVMEAGLFFLLCFGGFVRKRVL